MGSRAARQPQEGRGSPRYRTRTGACEADELETLQQEDGQPTSGEALQPTPAPLPTPDRLRSSAADAGSDSCGQYRMNLPRMNDLQGSCNYLLAQIWMTDMNAITMSNFQCSEGCGDHECSHHRLNYDDDDPCADGNPCACAGDDPCADGSPCACAGDSLYRIRADQEELKMQISPPSESHKKEDSDGGRLL